MAAGSVRVVAEQESQVVTLQCDSTDAKVAADYINLLAEEYIDQTSEERWKTYESTGDLADARPGRTEEEARGFGKPAGRLCARCRSAVYFGNPERSRREAEAASGRTRPSQQPIGSADSLSTKLRSRAKPETLPAVLDHGPISHYQMQLADLNRQMAELSSEFDAGPPQASSDCRLRSTR